MDPISNRIRIRDEIPTDIDSITKVTVAAFETLEISGHTEQFIVAALRSAGVLSVSLVAELDGEVIGHIAFSPVTFSDGTPDWHGLGPVSIQPIYQKQGVGTALIREGMDRLRKRNARGCCLVGHPEYYTRFGFRNAPEITLEGVPPQFLFALSFDGKYPKGVVSFHDGFKADRMPEGG